MASDVTDSALFYRAWAWLETHRKQLIWGAGVVAVVAFFGGLIIWKQAERQVAANDALSGVFIETVLTTNSPPAAAYMKVAATFPNTGAGGRALLFAAGKYFTDGNYAEAAAQFQRYLSDYRNGGFAAEAQLGVAACLDAQGKTPEAINAYKTVADRQSGETAIPQAKLSLARLYEALGNADLALNYYQQIARPEFGALGQEALARSQELMAKRPIVTPEQPAATTNAPVKSPLK